MKKKSTRRIKSEIKKINNRININKFKLNFYYQELLGKTYFLKKLKKKLYLKLSNLSHLFSKKTD